MDNQLAEFGKLFVTRVRDQSLFTVESIISGQMKNERFRLLHERLRDLTPEQIQVLVDFAYATVDQTIHHTLFLFETHPSWKIASPTNGVQDINQLSDGLCCELYTEDGWIRQYSHYSPSDGL